MVTPSGAIQARAIERDEKPTSLDVIRHEADILVAVNSGYLHMVDDASLFGGPSISAISPYTLQKINESLLAYKERTEEDEQQLKLQDEKREKKEDADEQKRDRLQDALEENSDPEWLASEHTYGSVTMTGKQMRDFAKHWRNNRAEVEAELRAEGHSQDLIDRTRKLTEVAVNKNLSEEQKDAAFEADPEAARLYEHTAEGLGYKTPSSNINPNNAPGEESSDKERRQRETLIDTKGVHAMADFNQAADKDSGEVRNKPELDNKPVPAPAEMKLASAAHSLEW